MSDPVWIAKFRTVGKTVIINEEWLNTLLRDEGLRFAPVYVLSITGEKNSGKTFILKILLRYLLNLLNRGQDKWLDNTDEILSSPIRDMEAEQTDDEIYLSAWPICVPHDGKRVLYLLIDSHGLTDDGRALPVFTTMASLMLVVSTLHIWNSSKNLKANAICDTKIHLQTAGKLLAENECSGNYTKTPFQRLVFLIRDWIGAGFGSSRGEKYIRKKIEESKTCEEKSRTWSKIKEQYKTVEAFLMPHPGPTFLSMDDDLATLDKTFKTKLKDLADFLVGWERVNGSEMLTTDNFVDLLLKTGAKINQLGPAFQIQEQVSPEEENESLLKHVKSEFDETINRVLSDVESTPKKKDELEQGLKQLESDVIQTFRNKARRKALNFRSYIETLNDHIKKQQEIVIMKNHAVQDILKRQKRAQCMAALDGSKTVFREMTREKKTQNEGDLKLLLERACSMARVEFDAKSDMAQDEKDSVKNDLEVFLSQESKSLLTDMKIQQQLKGLKLVQQRRNVEESGIEYKKLMEQVYEKQDTSLSDEQLRIEHDRCKKKALVIFKSEALCKGLEWEQFRNEFEEECLQQYARFQTINGELRKREHQDDVLESEMCEKIYDTNMNKIFSKSNLPRDSEIEDLHKIYCQETIISYKAAHGRPRKNKADENIRQKCRKKFEAIRSEVLKVRKGIRDAVSTYKKEMKQKFEQYRVERSREYGLFNKDLVNFHASSLRSALSLQIDHTHYGLHLSSVECDCGDFYLDIVGKIYFVKQERLEPTRIEQVRKYKDQIEETLSGMHGHIDVDQLSRENERIIQESFNYLGERMDPAARANCTVFLLLCQDFSRHLIERLQKYFQELERNRGSVEVSQYDQSSEVEDGRASGITSKYNRSTQIERSRATGDTRQYSCSSNTERRRATGDASPYNRSSQVDDSRASSDTSQYMQSTQVDDSRASSYTSQYMRSTQVDDSRAPSDTNKYMFNTQIERIERRRATGDTCQYIPRTQIERSRATGDTSQYNRGSQLKDGSVPGHTSQYIPRTKIERSRSTVDTSQYNRSSQYSTSTKLTESQSDRMSEHTRPPKNRQPSNKKSEGRGDTSVPEENDNDIELSDMHGRDEIYNVNHFLYRLTIWIFGTIYNWIRHE